MVGFNTITTLALLWGKFLSYHNTYAGFWLDCVTYTALKLGATRLFFAESFHHIMLDLAG